MVKKQIDVVGAVIRAQGKILCAQRGPNGHLPNMWEFPGGKVEEGESPRQALAREVAEELQCQVEVGAEIATTTHEYDFGIVTLTTFACELLVGVPRLTEHAAMTWVVPAELGSLEWAPADIEAVQLLSAEETEVKRQSLQGP